MGLPFIRRSPLSIFYIPPPRFLILLFFCFLALFLVFEVDDFVSRTKTIVGHNLEPTPWHVFPFKPSDQESKYSKASKIIQCSYLTTCGLNDTTPEEKQSHNAHDHDPPAQCPDFFRHIRRDLEPWAQTNITMAHVAEAQKLAAFRVVIVGGKLYVDFYYACVQSRAMFTVWGFLQLLKRYPGRVPDVDLMFDCMDKPTVNRTEHSYMPLPLFRYCTTPQHFDIPFPDWSYWGWSEINIEPWDQEFRNIKQGSRRRRWENKWPIAYWKGNPDVASPLRMELLNCNDPNNWRAQILRQDWGEAARKGFKESKLSQQCDHRYKIYAEGYAWSVSLKYILSCGSVPLIISQQYEDFLTRGLVPNINFLPIPPLDLCQSIKSAVDWGNQHPSQAKAIGRAAQDFMASLSMERVYDYMYHLVTEYSKLQTFQPVQPSTALEVCTEYVLCFADQKQQRWLHKSAAVPSSTPPCSLPN
ncbi:hypothetical protein ACJIZ3_012473 [Penstemon smallii]|uniref:Glycosyl transferase CAP10 domain-containing protein n=1 Tax=Penstemon smallii TaxID=265156 RepID=A0ABD3UPB1_9LAMI